MDKTDNPVDENDDISMTTQELHVLSELDRYYFGINVRIKFDVYFVF